MVHSLTLRYPARLANRQGLLDQAAPEAEAARLRLDIEKPQLCGPHAAIDQERRADDLAVAFPHPAALFGGNAPLEELAGDFGDQRLEGFVPAIFGGVERAVTGE